MGSKQRKQIARLRQQLEQLRQMNPKDLSGRQAGLKRRIAELEASLQDATQLAIKRGEELERRR